MNTAVHGIFCRFETFALVAAARKTGGNNLEKVASEAMRVSGFCDHVLSPTLPNVIYGESPLVLLKQLQERASSTINLYWHKQSKKYRTRRQRLDRPIAAVGVISVPPEWKVSEPRWQQFKVECIDWLREQFGGSRLRSVVEHLDEKCLHLHVFLVPLDGENLSSVHPGHAALQRLSGSSSPRDKKSAYQAAMRALLDNFHEVVGLRFGMVRRHIGARRMSRKQWHIWKWYQSQAYRQKELILLRSLASNVSQSDSSVIGNTLNHGPSDIVVSVALPPHSVVPDIDMNTCSDGSSLPTVHGATEAPNTGFLVSGRKARPECFTPPSMEESDAAPDYAWVRPRHA